MMNCDAKVMLGALLGLPVLVASAATNLVPAGDFGEATPKTVGAWCRSEDGAFSLFNEDLVWNNCGKLEVSVVRSAQNRRTRSAIVGFGQDGKSYGFAVKGDTTYGFSLDLKDGGAKSASVRVIAWNGDDYWKDRREVKVSPALKGLKLDPSWKTFKGTFKTPPDAKRAAVQVSIYSSEAYGGKLYPDGTHVLIDNIKVEESAHNLGAAPKDVSVPVRKALATGTEVADFISLRDKVPVPAAEVSRVRCAADGAALTFDLDFAEPGEVTVGTDAAPWHSDNVELCFGPTATGRRATRCAVGANGACLRLVDGEAQADAGFTADVAVRKGGWRAKVVVPYAALGLSGRPADGTAFAFNVGRQRRKAHTYQTWSALQQGFEDIAHYGTLVVGGYAAALKAKYGRDLPDADRSQYETAVAEAEAAALKARFDRFAKQKMSVAPIPVTSDFSLPFLPEEIFDPPAEIRLTAAVNEQKALPLAVANLTDRVEDYVFQLECNEKKWTGDFGLNGFPSGKIAVRKALRMMDVTVENPTLRFDALVDAGQAPNITVGPKEAGVVWYDFDTRGVKPGTYKGRLRVIPTCERGIFKQAGKGYDNIAYEGEMQVIPVMLEVLPVELPVEPPVPSGFFMGAANESAYEVAHQLGAGVFNLSPYAFRYPLDKDGNFDTSDIECVGAPKLIRDHRAWAAKRGVKVKFLICYSLVHNFRVLYNSKDDPSVRERLWPQFILAVKKTMNACGVDDADYWIETYDEPPANDFAGIHWHHAAAKKAAPTVQLEITLGNRKMTVDELRRIGDVTDMWIVWDSYFSEEPYRKLFADEGARGRRVCHYTCSTSMRESLDGYYRKKTWFGAFHRLDGDFMYQLNDHAGGLGARDFKTTTYGGFLRFNYGEAVPSVRTMAWREGVVDFKYVAKYLELAGDTPAAKAFVDKLVRRVMVDNRHDPAEADRARAELAREILKLAKKGN